MSNFSTSVNFYVNNNGSGNDNNWDISAAAQPCPGLLPPQQYSYGGQRYQTFQGVDARTQRQAPIHVPQVSGYAQQPHTSVQQSNLGTQSSYAPVQPSTSYPQHRFPLNQRQVPFGFAPNPCLQPCTQSKRSNFQQLNPPMPQYMSYQPVPMQRVLMTQQQYHVLRQQQQWQFQEMQRQQYSYRQALSHGYFNQHCPQKQDQQQQNFGEYNLEGQPMQSGQSHPRQPHFEATDVHAQLFDGVASVSHIFSQAEFPSEAPIEIDQTPNNFTNGLTFETLIEIGDEVDAMPEQLRALPEQINMEPQDVVQASVEYRITIEEDEVVTSTEQPLPTTQQFITTPESITPLDGSKALATTTPTTNTTSEAEVDIISEQPAQSISTQGHIDAHRPTVEKPSSSFVTEHYAVKDTLGRQILDQNGKPKRKSIEQICRDGNNARKGYLGMKTWTTEQKERRIEQKRMEDVSVTARRLGIACRTQPEQSKSVTVPERRTKSAKKRKSGETESQSEPISKRRRRPLKDKKTGGESTPAPPPSPPHTPSTPTTAPDSREQEWWEDLFESDGEVPTMGSLLEVEETSQSEEGAQEGEEKTEEGGNNGESCTIDEDHAQMWAEIEATMEESEIESEEE